MKFLFTRRKILLVVAIFLFGIAAGVFIFNFREKEINVSQQTQNYVDRRLVGAKLGEKEILLEFAVTAEEKARGLSGRDSLSDDQGMIFVFENPDQYSFWMKDMRFALDFIWLRDNVVVEITEDVLPPAIGKELAILKPAEAVNAVLEVNAGWVRERNIEIGDRLNLLR